MKAMLFDLFNTVFDVSTVPSEVMKAYVSHVTEFKRGEFLFDDPAWREIKPHPGSVDGIATLRRAGIKCVAFGNGSLALVSEISDRSGIEWDIVVSPWDDFSGYKPNTFIYDAAFGVVANAFAVKPCELAMVTANPGFGDLHSAIRMGVIPIAIRNGLFVDVLSLANSVAAL